MNAYLIRHVAWWRRLMAWMSRPVVNPRPILSRTAKPTPAWPTADPDRHPVVRRHKHRPGQTSIRWAVLADRIQVESRPGRHALTEEPPAPVLRDTDLLCGPEKVLLHSARSAHNTTAVNA